MNALTTKFPLKLSVYWVETGSDTITGTGTVVGHDEIFVKVRHWDTKLIHLVFPSEIRVL